MSVDGKGPVGSKAVRGKGAGATLGKEKGETVNEKEKRRRTTGGKIYDGYKYSAEGERESGTKKRRVSSAGESSSVSVSAGKSRVGVVSASRPVPRKVRPTVRQIVFVRLRLYANTY